MTPEGPELDDAPRGEASELFERYVVAREAGHDPGIEELYRLAGDERTALAKRVRVYEDLQDLGDLLNPEEGETYEEPTSLGRFQLLETLGSTKLSRVYRAQDPTLGREVALKVISRQLLGIEDDRSWMLNEGRSLARLQHPGIVRVFEHGRVEDLYFITMEIVRGPSLAEVLRFMRAAPDSPVVREADESIRARAADLAPLRARCRLAVGIAHALAYCHEQGVVHRDVKPSNVLLTEACEPRLIDFGLAHLESDEESHTQITQRLLGTPAYIAPEQVDSGRTGTSTLSDQFSLGVVLYELLTLVNPFDDGTLSGTMERISRDAPPPPRSIDRAIPEGLERVVLHCLENDPGRRYPAMRGLAADLDAVLEDRPISIAAPTPGQLARLWLRRHRRQVRAAGFFAVLLAVLAAGAWTYGSSVRAAEIGRAVRAVDTSLRTNLSPPQFSDTLYELAALQGVARELDRRPLHALVFGDATGDVNAAILRTADRMLSVMDAEETGYRRKGLEFDPTAWKGVLDLVHYLGAAPPELEAKRALGRVVYPPETLDFERRLYVWTASPHLQAPLLHEVAVSEVLRAGHYRLITLWEDGSVRHELDFEVHSDAPPMHLDVRPHSTPEDMLRVPLDTPTTHAYLEAAGAAGTAPIGRDGLLAHESVLIGRRPVTWREIGAWVRGPGFAFAPEVKRKLRRCRSRQPASTPIGPDTPAMVSLAVATAYAESLGARLPTALELQVAFQHASDIEFGPHASGMGAELTSSPARFPGGSTWVLYDQVEGRSTGEVHVYREILPILGGSQGVTFRLAMTDRLAE